MTHLEPIRKLGEGAAAEVLLAQDSRTQRCVVLEILRRELKASPDLVLEFQRGGKLRRTFEHPNLARRVAEGATDDGRPYLFTEPLSGRTLRSWLRARGPLRGEERAAVLAPLASAVEYLHGQGLVLKNFGSASVFLDPGRDPARPKLFDASLSLMRRGALTEPPRDCALLEPEYMAPERILGNRADARSDLYALGVLFYEALVGVPPFGGASRHAIYRHHLGSPVPHLPADAGPWAAVVERCLAKEPEERFPTAHSLLEALDACRGTTAHIHVPRRRAEASPRAVPLENPTVVAPPRRELLVAARTDSAPYLPAPARKTLAAKAIPALVVGALLACAGAAAWLLRVPASIGADAPAPSATVKASEGPSRRTTPSELGEPAALIVDEPAVVRAAREPSSVAGERKQATKPAPAKKGTRSVAGGRRKGLRREDLRW